MRRERTEKVREEKRPVQRSSTTKQMHQRLLRALGDRRVKRAFR
jgi:hypothetical protein